MGAVISRGVKLCGSDETDPASRTLRAGPLSVELENGNLRYVRFAGIEVLRGVAFLVRDENWGTFTPTIADLKVVEDDDSFQVSYRGDCADAKRRLTFTAEIVGRRDGSLAFTVIATAETDVETNRAGFVMLHPLAGVAGRTMRVVHTDGRTVTDQFPELISPSQPVFDIRSLAHEIASGVWATCTMAGDAFEMEDQRNWGDASYKTYQRPLAKPWPYTLAKGSRHEQSVRLNIAGSIATAAVSDPASVAVALGGKSGQRLPSIGIGVPAEEARHALDAIDLLRRLMPRLLLCHVDARQALDHAGLAAYRSLAEATGAELGLEIVIPGSTDPAVELKAVAVAVSKANLKPATVAVSPASDLMSHQPGHEDPMVPPATVVFAAARAAFPGVRLGGGMFSYFTELNRKRPPLGLLDFVTHTTCPIVHAADDRSVMETIEALPAIIASTKALSGGAAYRIGPSAIGCRQNPYGKGTLDNPGGGRACLARVDPRQRGLFGAAWTLGYLAAAARGGIEAVTLGATTGPFGFIYRRTAYPQPHFDELEGPAFYPAFQVLAGLAAQSGQAMIEATPSRAGAVAALAYGADGRTVVWLANLTSQKLTVALDGLPKGEGRAAVIDAASFARVTTDPDALDALAQTLVGRQVVLDAYAVARVEAAP
jgi:D-apionolactonase